MTKLDYRAWLHQVDTLLVRYFRMHISDVSGFDWFSAWNQGLSPQAATGHALSDGGAAHSLQ